MASSGVVGSPLQAEAKALLFASEIAEVLQLHQATILTDNQVLARAAAFLATYIQKVQT